MATSIPPHNLREVAGAVDYMIDHYDTVEDITTEDLMQFIQGPDFPTGGMVVGHEAYCRLIQQGVEDSWCAGWRISRRSRVIASAL